MLACEVVVMADSEAASLSAAVITLSGMANFTMTLETSIDLGETTFNMFSPTTIRGSTENGPQVPVLTGAAFFVYQAETTLSFEHIDFNATQVLLDTTSNVVRQTLVVSNSSIYKSTSGGASALFVACSTNPTSSTQLLATMTLVSLAGVQIPGAPTTSWYLVDSHCDSAVAVLTDSTSVRSSTSQVARGLGLLKTNRVGGTCKLSVSRSSLFFAYASSLVDFASSLCLFNLEDSTLSNQAALSNYRSSYASITANSSRSWYLSASLESLVEGYGIYNPRLTLSGSTIRNCILEIDLSRDSLTILTYLNIPSVISLDATASPPPLDSPSAVQIIGGLLDIRTNAILRFSSPLLRGNSDYLLSGVTIGPQNALGLCSFYAMRLTLDPHSTLVCNCHLDLTEGLLGLNTTLRSAFTRGENPLGPELKVAWDGEYEATIHLATFMTLAVVPNPETPEVPALRNPQEGQNQSIMATGLPASFRILWPTSPSAPVPPLGVRYRLFTSAVATTEEYRIPLVREQPGGPLFDAIVTPFSSGKSFVSFEVSSFEPAPTPSISCSNLPTCTINGSISLPTFIVPPNTNIVIRKPYHRFHHPQRTRRLYHRSRMH